MTLFEIVKIVKGTLISGNLLNKKVGKLCIDSRIMEDNDMFVCIKGKNTDGNKYINMVIDKASIIITEEDIKIEHSTPILKVKSVKEALIKIGTYYRVKYISKPLIAITGSVGKTTTKELIAHILEDKYKVLKTSGNYNNDLGVPLTLSKLDDSYDVIVLELGMNHKKEIKKLARMCLPNIAVITNIGTSHIGYLKSQKNIFKAKMEITSYLKNGTLIVNGQDKYLKKIKSNKKYKVLKTALIKKYKIKDKLKFKINNNCINFNILSEYLIPNILLAFEVSKIMHIEEKKIVEKINNFKPLDKRANIIKLNNNITLIDDSYNASKESVLASIDMLKHYQNKKLLILGDILELGNYSKKIHKQIGMYLEKSKNIKTITVGNNTKIINRPNFNNNEDLIKHLKNIDIKNTTILIKGSRGMHLEKIKDYFINTYSVNNF